MIEGVVGRWSDQGCCVAKPVPSAGSIGALVAHYSYDALGRVIRVQRPTSIDTRPASGGTLAITDYYYDGVRVVQEVGWGGGGTPGAGQQGAGGGGIHGGGAGVPVRAQRLANGGVNTTAPGLPRRANEMTGPNGTVAWGTCAPTPAENAGGWDWSDRRLEREYVWSADSSAYVDECVAQLVYTNAHEPAAGSISGQAAYRGDDTSATVLYVLADHNANVIGLTDDRGRLVGQYAYTPYGELRASEYFAPDTSLPSADAVVAAKGNVLGHQGLRTERFDRPWEGALDAATAAYGGGSYRALNHNRNRTYDPAAGRFIEQDPNGLGVPTLGSSTFGGSASTSDDVTPNVQGHYGDGMNGHQAYGSTPRTGRDALGLFLREYNLYEGLEDPHDPFTMVDDFIAEDLGSKAAFLERLVGGVHAAAYVGSWLASWIPGPVGIAAGIANGMMGVPGNLQGTLLLTAMRGVDYGAMFMGGARLVAHLTGAAMAAGTVYMAYQGMRATTGVVVREAGIAGRISRLKWNFWNVRSLSANELRYCPSKRGNAPFGIDGKPVEVHHVAQNPHGPFEEILARDHRGIPTQRPGISAAERAEFRAAKKEYWERMWDEGRFNDLPWKP